MFIFEKLIVYQKARLLNKDILVFLETNNIKSSNMSDQLKRAASSILLNIAEGSGRQTKADKKNFYTIAKGSAYECASILGLIQDSGKIGDVIYADYYNRFLEIIKMLTGLIKSLDHTQSKHK